MVLGAESADAACDAGEVAPPDDDGVVGKFGGVPAVSGERSQWRMAPSEPPETRIGWTGCHASAVFRRLGWIGERLEGKRARTADFLFVSAQDDPLFHRADVEHTHGPVARGAREQVPVGCP